MKISSLVEVVSAIHLTYYVNSPFPERGGLMLVGPPASLKTAVTEVLDNYPNAILVSDLTVKQGARLREDFIRHSITTLAFSDFAKLYQRDIKGSANIEGFIRALTGEGFRRANWEDQRMTAIPARACVIGCMTSHCYNKHYGDWLDDGFARRFLWAHITLKDPQMIINAIVKGERLDFGNNNGFDPRVPTSRDTIKWDTTEEESRILIRMLSHQPGKEIGLTLLKKILACLRWKYKRLTTRPMEILTDFSASLTKNGVELEL